MTSGLNISIVRTVGGSTALPDASTIQPRLHVTARPYSSPSALRIALSITVSALGILRPIQRKAIAHEPVSEINIADQASRDCSAVTIQISRLATHWPSRDESVKIVGGLRAASIMQAVLASAELTALWCVDTPEANARPVEFQRVAGDDAGLASDFGSQCDVAPHGEPPSD